MNNNNHKIRGSNVLDLRKIVAERKKQEKWKRKLMAKQEMKRYLAYWSRIKKEQKREFWKIRFLKLRTFLSWGARLLVPDFLIGHPNLWDNLKTFWKSPNFHPLRMALVAWLIFSITFGSVGIYSLRQAVQVFAAIFVDDTQVEFDAGTYNNTQWDPAPNNWVELNATGATAGLGNYISSVKDAGGNSSWNSIAWMPQRPTGKELPDNAGIETAYPTGNADMTGNVLLLHLNEANGTIIDSSGQGNNGTQFGGVTYGAPGKLNTALDFDGVDDFVEVPDLGMSGDFTLETWIKSTEVPTQWSGFIGTSGGWISGSFYLGWMKDGNGRLRFDRNLGGAYNSVDSINVFNDGIWHHVVGVWEEGVSSRIYVNGILENEKLSTATGWVENSALKQIGRQSNMEFDGLIDEVAIYNRALSATEIADRYKRGALRLKYQVRSCNDSVCAGESFIGPDGTTTSFYEWGTTNSTSTPSFTLTNVPNNQYFQYKAYFETDDPGFSPELKSVTVDYTLSLIQPPDTPVNSLPTNGATGQDLNVSLTGSAYSDPDTNPQINTEWRVDNNSDFSSPVWTRTAGVAETSTSVATSTGTFANELAGETELDHNTIYYWQVRYSNGQWSSWSTATNFTTNLIHAPSNVSPADGAILVTFTPLLKASAFSDDQIGHTHAASQWLVDDNPDFSSPIYDSGETASAETSHVVPGDILANYTTYFWKVRYKCSGGCWSDYSTSTSFVIQMPKSAVEVRPLFGNIMVDQGDTVAIDVQLISMIDGSPLNTGSATINIYNPGGIKIVDGASMTYLTGSDGIYRYIYTVPSTSGSYLYEVTAVQAGRFGYGAANFEVRTLAADVTKIESDLAAHEAAQATERAAQEISRAEVSEIKKEVEAGILEAPKTVKSGNTITIKYRADSGLTGAGAPKLNVYDASDVQRVIDATMAEIGTTGVYSATTTLETGWGTGFFTIIVSETTNNTSDHTQIFVGAYDIEDIGVRTADIQARVTDVQNNMDILIGAMIVTQSTVNDTAASTTAFVTNLVNSTDDFYKNAVLTFTSGALDGQSRRISAYDGTLKKITLDPALTSAPANGDAFTIVTQNVRIEEQMIEHEAAQADFRTVMRADTALTLSKLDSILADINRIGTPSNRVEVDAMLPVLNQISTDLKQVLTGVETIDFAADPTFQTLLDISRINASDLGEVKNKLADLQAVSSVTRRIVEQVVIEPTIETWMTFDSVVFNFLIANPADTEREINFKAHLPAEVKPEHILDLSGLNIDFDIGANTFYVHSQIILGPGESVKRRVEIKDIWFFTDKEIESLKQEAQTLVEPLAGTQYEAQGAVLKSTIETTLDIISITQEEGYRSPQDHIIAYRINQEEMEHVKRNLERLKDLVVQAGAARGVVGRVGGIQTFATWGIILAIVFGFALLAAVIFAMWRHQTMLAMAAMGISRKEVMAQMGKKKRKKSI